ncbi:MAG: hypothetical protein ABJA70_10735 [Chryseolinea sp.]
MIGLALVYFVGKSYYQLAELHNKSKWAIAILGVASYYVGLVVGAIIITLIYEFGFSKSIEEVNDVLIGLMSVPAGILACWGLYKILENSWSKSKSFSIPDEILDANFVNQHSEE